MNECKQKANQVNRFCPVKKTIANKTKQKKYHTLSRRQNTHTHSHIDIQCSAASTLVSYSHNEMKNKQTKQK